MLNENYYQFWDNVVLINASNSEEAYKKSIIKGKEYQVIYKNHEEETVEWKFAGIREMVEIYNNLEDGEEIAYSEGFCRKKENILKMIPSKEKLGIFKWEKSHKK